MNLQARIPGSPKYLQKKQTTKATQCNVSCKHAKTECNCFCVCLVYFGLMWLKRMGLFPIILCSLHLNKRCSFAPCERAFVHLNAEILQSLILPAVSTDNRYNGDWSVQNDLPVLRDWALPAKPELWDYNSVLACVATRALRCMCQSALIFLPLSLPLSLLLFLAEPAWTDICVILLIWVQT